MNGRLAFFCLPQDLVVRSTKIRTMRLGAEDELSSPFRHASFADLRGDSRVIDNRFVHRLRRTGLDGFTEIVYGVSAGKWDFVGLRPYTSPEREGTRILHRLVLDGDLSLDERAEYVLKTYPNNIQLFQPRPAIFGPLAAFDEKVSHMTRLFGDVAYLKNVDPVSHFRVLYGGIYNRMIRGVGAK